MADRAMNVYLNDHLAGAMLGSDLAEQIQNQSEGTALGELMKWLAPQIEEDRQTLIALMERLHISRNPVKQATAWMAEKASRVKLGGRTSGEPEVGMFMAVETLCLGVQGKLALWTSLKEVADRYELLASVKLDEMIERAETQHSALERERRAASRRALGSAVEV
jgi:hypothetical protein